MCKKLTCKAKSVRVKVSLKLCRLALIRCCEEESVMSNSRVNRIKETEKQTYTSKEVCMPR